MAGSIILQILYSRDFAIAIILVKNFKKPIIFLIQLLLKREVVIYCFLRFTGMITNAVPEAGTSAPRTQTTMITGEMPHT